ncbi:MAG TPA: nuclear transport factor 2 family protein [Pseudolysinimonas sp.]|nr:nuclear transport factor 2 family protein [Pseudolysinimonas sp.]
MHAAISFEDYVALTELKARYFEAVDDRDWVSLRSLFTADAEFDGFAFTSSGVDGFIDALTTYMTGAVSNHRAFLPQFRVIDDATIRGTWSMHDTVTWEPGSRAYKGFTAPDLYGIDGYGRYQDEYRRSDNGWQISFCRIARTRIVPLVGQVPPSFDFPAVASDPGWLI